MSRADFLKTVAGSAAVLAGASISWACADSLPSDTGGNGSGPQGLTPSGTIWYDNRTTLQAATTQAQADALFGNTSSPQLVTDFDGTGRHALRCSVHGTCGDTSMGQLYLYGVAGATLPTAAEFYVQWRQRFGRHALDAGATVGAVDAVSWNGALLGCPAPYLEKKLYVGVNPGTDRFDFDWYTGSLAWDIVGNNDLQYNVCPGYETSGGEEHVITYWVQIRPTCAIRTYLDGVQNGLASRPDAGPYTSVNYIRINNVWSDPGIDQTHYVWDHVIWTP